MSIIIRLNHLFQMAFLTFSTHSMEMDILKLLLVFVLSSTVTWTKESKFCRSHVLGIPNYCGNRYAECGPGYVINIVEVEKGDESSCISCYCCDGTSFNAEWTDLMKDHCNGRGKCKTSNVRDEEERAVKTVYKCITELTPKSTGSSPLTTNAETQQSSSSTSSQNTQKQLKILDEEDTFPVAVTVAIPTVAIAILAIVIAMVLVYRKRKLNKPKPGNHPNATINRAYDGVLDETRFADDESTQPQPDENNQYENYDQNGYRGNHGGVDDSLATGQVETNYDHLGQNGNAHKSQPVNVYNLANYRGNDLENDNDYNSTSNEKQGFGRNDEYSVVSHGAQDFGSNNEYDIANREAKGFGTNNNYNIADNENQGSSLDNKYNTADCVTHASGVGNEYNTADCVTHASGVGNEYDVANHAVDHYEDTEYVRPKLVEGFGQMDNKYNANDVQGTQKAGTNQEYMNTSELKGK